MKITVLVKPNARKEGVERLPDGSYRVAVNASPHEGRANESVIEALAEFFGVPKSSFWIVVGKNGRRKVIEINTTKIRG